MRQFEIKNTIGRYRPKHENKENGKLLFSTREKKDEGESKVDYSESTIFRSFAKNRLAVSFVALGTAFGAVTPAFATINNTVTATGTPPVGPAVTATADETVTVEPASPALVVTKSASVPGPVNASDTITYTYTAENTGNQTLTNVSMADPHDANATGTLSAISFAAVPLTDAGAGGGTASNGVATGDSTDDSADAVWDTLAPGDTITWTATYVVTTADFQTAVGGDGSIDNTATGSATAPGGVAGAITDDSDPVTVTVTAPVATLSVTKIATPDSGYGVGDTITYNYVVTNTGNVPMTNVGLADNVTAGSGTDPVPTLVSINNGGGLGASADDGADNDVDTLAPGDTAEFTGTYVVTQSDVDTLQ